jgi:hypothetical protein
MKFRARANGNVVDDVPAALVGVLYDPIEEAPEDSAPPRGRSSPKEKPARRPYVRRKRDEASE